ncbi:MAG: hypothetical protein ABGZ17_12155, partial [Planctomycetaceae bacterium]
SHPLLRKLPEMRAPPAVHPLLTGRRKLPLAMTCRLSRLKASHEAGKLTLIGRLQGGPQAIGLIGHNDPQVTGGDYDAVG